MVKSQNGGLPKWGMFTWWTTKLKFVGPENRPSQFMKQGGKQRWKQGVRVHEGEQTCCVLTGRLSKRLAPGGTIIVAPHRTIIPLFLSPDLNISQPPAVHHPQHWSRAMNLINTIRSP
jgi:hypothetical protein